MSEDTVDPATRMAILKQLSGKKPVPVTESRTPGVRVQPTQEIKAVKETEAKSDIVVCLNCNHKIWNDGSEWQHSGKPHNDNCDCREALPASGANSKPKKVFDASTPFDQLLEACADSHNAVKAIELEETILKDEVRSQVIEKISNSGEIRILKEWRF